MGLPGEDRISKRAESQAKGSRIISALKERIATDKRGRAEQEQVGCHNDGSCGTHNDN